MIKFPKILFVIFLLTVTLNGCKTLFVKKSKDNNFSSNYSQKEYTPPSTDPWKKGSKSFRKKHTSRWDTKSKNSWRKTYRQRSKIHKGSHLTNYNRKGLNKSTYRTNADPNPINSFSFGFGIGPTNSITDVGGSNKKKASLFDMQMIHTRINATSFLRYKFSNLWTASSWLSFGNIEATDANSKSKIRIERGYSFTNYLLELSIRPELNFPYLIVNKQNSGSITTFDYYIFTGLNAFYHSPNFTSSTPVKKEYTTGYKKIQLAMPIGTGCYFSFPSRWKLGFDIAFRRAFSDHIDGVASPNSRPYDYYVFANFNIHYTFSVGTSLRKDNNFFKPKLNRKKEKNTEFKRKGSIFFR